MASTTNGWPYVAPADHPLEYPSVSQQLANKLETFLAADTGWVTIPTRAGFTANATPPQCRKIGKEIYLRGGWNNTGLTAGASSIVADLPPGYRPPVGLYMAMGTGSAATMAIVVLMPNGTVEIRTGATLSSYYLFGGQSYLVD